MPNPSPKHLAAGDLDDELTRTRRLLERVPEEYLGWKPHGRSWSLGALAMHLANLPLWQTAILRRDEFDMAGLPPPGPEPSTCAAILDAFDEHAAALRQAFDELNDSALTAPWTLRRGDEVLLQRPRAAMLRSIGISHMIHHRGQLTVYLRLLDVPLPAIYGPTADEQAGFEA